MAKLLDTDVSSNFAIQYFESLCHASVQSFQIYSLAFIHNVVYDDH